MSVAIVTGAGRGIGRATALALAEDGHDVVVTARTDEDLQATAAAITGAGAGVAAVVGDVTDPARVEETIAAAHRLGRVELLVNNAGVGGGSDVHWETPVEDWWRTVTVNVRGPALMCHGVLPEMVSAGAGRIINLNSLAGMRPLPLATAYSVSKAALARLTDCLDAALEGTGVRVFDLSPGLVRTSMTDGLPFFDDVPEDGWTPVERSVAAVRALASGSYDALSGRFIHAEDDLDTLLALVAENPGARRLRLVPAGEDDPLLS